MAKRKASYKHARNWLWNTRQRHCVYCRMYLTLTVNQTNTLTVDHKIPLSRGGLNERVNYAPACYACNTAKGDLTYFEYVTNKEKTK